MATDRSTAFDFGGTDPSTFRCPDCAATAPSTSVPYDSLGYAVCPECSYTTGLETEGTTREHGIDV
ncbi:hypothetical protein [Halorubrum cibi]|uniref:Small CPxCG-related zinc finger protein n=1 Tax=Halorubrum cibi TaxID=413815 RepID=A0A521AT70_9EURY|nr:hypothetical protein [Halorubrum cibi]SMO37820.1 hypothetical protein SAMN06264867_101353 [Halorubrum cibi]